LCLIQLNGTLPVSAGSVCVTLVPVAPAASLVGPGVIGIEPDGLGVVGDGPLVVAQFLVGAPPADVDVGSLRVEFDDFVVVSDDLPIVVKFFVGILQIVKVAGGNPDRAFTLGQSVVYLRPQGN